MAEDRELTYGEIRLRKSSITHGWWFTPQQWGFGIALVHDPKSPCWAEKWAFSLELGPLCWAFAWEADR